MEIKVTFSRESPIWWFATKYVSLLMCWALPKILCLLGLVIIFEPKITKIFSTILMQIYEQEVQPEQMCHISKIMFYICFIFFFILTTIFIFMAFIMSHRSLQNNYSSKQFQIQRDGTIASDIRFISTWLSIGVIFHILMMRVGMSGSIYAFCSTYLVLSTVFYFLIRWGWCGHGIRKRARVLKA